MKFYETANKSHHFSSVFCSKNDLERISKCFLFRKLFGMKFRVFFLPKMVRNGIPKFSLLKMVWKGIPRFYHSKIVWNGIPRVFLFQEMVWSGIPRFFSSAKQAEFRRGIIFLSENGNPTQSRAHVGKDTMTGQRPTMSSHRNWAPTPARFGKSLVWFGPIDLIQGMVCCFTWCGFTKSESIRIL